jgi:hypothetical protein
MPDQRDVTPSSEPNEGGHPSRLAGWNFDERQNDGSSQAALPAVDAPAGWQMSSLALRHGQGR